jgi:lipoprotein-anchoring transpeptidase ErfK/SrfK
MLLTSRRFLRLSPAILAAALLAACVDPAAGPTASTQALPKAGENVYVATMDAGIADPRASGRQRSRKATAARSSPMKPTSPSGTIIINPKTQACSTTSSARTRRSATASRSARPGSNGPARPSWPRRRPWPTLDPAEGNDRAQAPNWQKFDEVGQPGGPTNPLGARAIYLTSGGRDYGYRIHGTPEWQSIGRNASSGCIRMINQDVLDLYSRLTGGEKVIVLTASGEMPKGLYIPKTIAPKASAKPKAAEVVVPVGAVPALKVLPPPSITTGTPLVAPAVAPVTPAPAETSTTAPVATAPACKVALVDGVCPPGN